MGAPPSGGIPRVIHQCWIGPDPVPLQWTATWKKNHPQWGHRLWREADLDALPWTPGLRGVYDRYIKDDRYCGAINVARVLILHGTGGVYIDADMVSREPLEDAPFMRGSLWVSQSPHNPGRTQNAAMGVTKGHPLMRTYLEHMAQAELIHPSWQMTGSVLFDHVWKEHHPEAACVVVPSPAFHPRTKRNQPNPAAKLYSGNVYASHHFYSSQNRSAGKTSRTAE